MIMAVAGKYIGLAKAEHTQGGITYDAAKAKNYESV